MPNHLHRLALTALGMLFALAGCTSIPAGLRPVENFDANRYLGKWYEIARLDHSFERGLTRVCAEYSRRPDGSISVVNRGYNAKTGQWSEAHGVARFIGDSHIGSLKVSFFRPFWGGYHIIALDEPGYGYAMIAGPNRSYLWILSREKTLPHPVLSSLISKAQNLGFNTGELIIVDQKGRD
ncbi:MAG: lipocalin family protein [Verrucomicrobiota bacterium]